jgi:hypothetical protein
MPSKKYFQKFSLSIDIAEKMFKLAPLISIYKLKYKKSGKEKKA